MNSTLRVVIGFASVMLLWLLAIGVWPTAYRYDRVGAGKDERLVRTSRFGGETQTLGKYGWTNDSLSPSAGAGDVLSAVEDDMRGRLIPKAAVELLEKNSTAHATTTAIGQQLSVTIRNVSGWSLTGLDIQIDDRVCSVGRVVFFDVGETRTFDTNVIDCPLTGHEKEWHIVNAKGRQSSDARPAHAYDAANDVKK